MSKENTCLLVVDVQERLVPLMQDHEELAWNISRLLEAASVLKVQTWGTEQYPKGLGATLPSIRQGLSSLQEKLMFSCRECLHAWQNLQTPPITTKVLLVGIETHICIQQTAFDLLANGHEVYLAVDAISSRHPHDHEVALRRMERAGVQLTTTESAMFEWCEIAGTPEFKQISRLAIQTGPKSEERD